MPPDSAVIPTAVAQEMRRELPAVAERTVAEIIVEVPSYADAFSGDMGRVIGNAVELALGGFLELATARTGADPSTPIRPALEGAYELGRGEARSGRSMDALLAVASSRNPPRASSTALPMTRPMSPEKAPA